MRNFVKQAFFVASVIAALDLTSIFAHAAGTDAGQYVSPARTFSTNSFWIMGRSGVVMVDTQFLPKEGIDALNAAEKATGKKVVTAIVLHPNPDKFNGTPAYQARGVQVITSDQVRKQIPAVHEIRLGWFAQEYAPDYPAQAAKPYPSCTGAWRERSACRGAARRHGLCRRFGQPGKPRLARTWVDR
jgi:glyoxylase-like metal-dependent hydrolase (beta-lactamase superfamily II)